MSALTEREKFLLEIIHILLKQVEKDKANKTTFTPAGE
jgi:hypothetical protein